MLNPSGGLCALELGYLTAKLFSTDNWPEDAPSAYYFFDPDKHLVV